MKAKILILTMVFAVMAISCSKDRNDDTNNITAEEAGINSKMDMANDDAVDVISEQESNTYNDPTNGRGTGDIATSALAPCATVTRVPAFGTPLTVGQTVRKTINFGTTGCTLPNGNIVKGIIEITFVYDPGATSHTVTFTFNDFYHNNIKFNGSKDYTRTMTAATASSAAHPIVTVNINLTATLPDGRVIMRTGQRVREFIAGFSTPVNVFDDEHKITGSWVTTFPNSTIQTATITSPLILKMSCAAPPTPTAVMVQGVITYIRGSHTATLDFGNGSCDNIAIFTKDGVSIQINLR